MVERGGGPTLGTDPFGAGSDVEGAVLFDPDAPVLGNPKGDVTIVEFLDYQCPYGKKSHPDVVRLVKEDGRIRNVMKDWQIFGKPSLYASRLVLAAGKDAAKARNALMAMPGRLTPEEINQTLAKAGLDQEILNAAYLRDRDRVNAPDSQQHSGRELQPHGDPRLHRRDDAVPGGH